ncbi:MAG TPA: pyridoxamine 5'-phosphate oxidase family protein [Candidatus Saccharimonadales bacterium]|nr:pyridoxamine 5'-phosphate oxidase family protein [Candidatus Saccharimonadales bacterium]
MAQDNLLSKYSPEELSARVKEIIERIKYITIATISEQHEPWNAPTFFAYDDKFNLYWGSPARSQHSQNIRANGQAYIVIYDSTVTPGTGKGVYIRAFCEELSNQDEMRAAFNLIRKRRGDISYWEFEEFQPDRPIRLYKAEPKHIYTNGGVMVDGEYLDSRVEVTL